jgi:parallel beta-helix repeat protein
MRKRKNKKILITNIVILLLVSSIIPTILATNENNNSINHIQFQKLNTKGIFFVGGTGPSNYSIIQDAIDAASNGDRIYVYDESAPYYEHLFIDKSIHLIGENKDTTIIDGNWSGEVVNIVGDETQISGFTLQNGVLGIYIQSNNNTITNNNIILNQEEGVYLIESEGTKISYNLIADNEDGIELEDAKGNLIEKNNISNNADHGIEIICSEKVDYYNLVKSNKISSNNIGIYVENSGVNEIIRNNFEDNLQSAYFVNCKNSWVHNYWDKGRILPKCIFGSLFIGTLRLPWINVDWRPAHAKNIWFKSVEVVIETSLGDMLLDIYPNIMPITSTNFKLLADIDFFDGLVFHRVIENFVIQGGGYYPNGTQKDSPFGPINLETHPDVLHVDGAISMARTSNPNSATSQFFICDTAQPHLDGNYSAFGKITEGFDVLQIITSVETTMKYGLSNWPVDDVIIYSISVENW